MNSVTESRNPDSSNKAPKTRASFLDGVPAFGIRARKVFYPISITLFFFSMYVAGFGLADFMTIRGVHAAIILVSIFLLFPSGLFPSNNKAETVTSVVLASVAALSVFWFITNFNRLSILHRVEGIDILIGTLVILVTLEACRRSIGWSITLLGAAAILYGFLGSYLPGPLWHVGFDWSYIVQFIVVGDYGLFGAPIGVVATFVTLFLYIGALLQVTGGLDRFMNIAHAAAGNYTGGAGKVAVMSSGMFGVVSGATVANVATSGPVTIPMMKRAGYRPSFAAAVESTSSAGGQIVPPIMGATAFLLADFAGVTYWDVAKSAIIPAILLYASLLMMVHLHSCKEGLRGLRKEDLPDLRSSLVGLIPILLPIAWLSSAGRCV